MKLTSQVIKNKEFKKGVRGYIQEEVDDFMKLIAQDYDAALNQVETLTQKISAMDESIARYSKMENDIQMTLVTAQSAVQDARREAEQLLEKARAESESIIDKAKRDVLLVLDEFDSTKKEYTDFRSKFKEFMELQMETFDEMDKKFVNRYEELQNKPSEAGKAAEEGEAGDIEEAENFEDVKSFFESEIVGLSVEKEEAEAPDFDDIKGFFGQEKPIEEYKRTKE